MPAADQTLNPNDRTIALIPSKYRSVPADQAAKICRDYAVYGIEAMSNLPRAEGSNNSKPFRFVYFSGSVAERDPSKKPLVMGDYLLLRGDAENKILAYAQQNPGKAEACIAKPGFIYSPDKHNAVVGKVVGLGAAVLGFGNIDVRDLVAGLLGQVVDGFEKDTLMPADLERIGKESSKKLANGGK